MVKLWPSSRRRFESRRRRSVSRRGSGPSTCTDAAEAHFARDGHDVPPIGKLAQAVVDDDIEPHTVEGDVAGLAEPTHCLEDEQRAPPDVERARIRDDELSARRIGGAGADICFSLLPFGTIVAVRYRHELRRVAGRIVSAKSVRVPIGHADDGGSALDHGALQTGVGPDNPLAVAVSIPSPGSTDRESGPPTGARSTGPRRGPQGDSTMPVQTRRGRRCPTLAPGGDQPGPPEGSSRSRCPVCSEPRAVSCEASRAVGPERPSPAPPPLPRDPSGSPAVVAGAARGGAVCGCGPR